MKSVLISELMSLPPRGLLLQNWTCHKSEFGLLLHSYPHAFLSFCLLPRMMLDKSPPGPRAILLDFSAFRTMS